MRALVLAAADPLDHVLPHRLFDLGPIHVTNQMFMAFVAAVLMLLIFPVLFRRATYEAPTGAKNARWSLPILLLSTTR